MTQSEFNAKAPLLTRQEVIDCGIADELIGDLSVKLLDAATLVPHGKIGAVPIGNGTKKKYRKCDVAKIVGFAI